MRTIEEISEEKYGQALRMIIDSGISIHKEEAIYLAKKFKDIFLEGAIEIHTHIPRISQDKKRLHCYNGRSVIGYHLINGEWVHIAQIFSDSGVAYYTKTKREYDKGAESKGSN